MDKNKKLIILLIGVGVIIISLTFLVNSRFYKTNHRSTISCNFLNAEEILQKVKKIDNSITSFYLIEKNTHSTPSEGTNIKFYYEKSTDDLVLLEVTSLATIARYISKYYVQDNDVYFIDSVTDEWNLQKLYGENGELSAAEGKYVIGTSTKEQYLISDKKLCKYIAEKSRVESVAVTKSDPLKDVKGLLDMYEFIISNEIK